MEKHGRSERRMKRSKKTGKTRTAPKGKLRNYDTLHNLIANKAIRNILLILSLIMITQTVSAIDCTEENIFDALLRGTGEAVTSAERTLSQEELLDLWDFYNTADWDDPDCQVNASRSKKQDGIPFYIQEILEKAIVIPKSEFTKKAVSRFEDYLQQGKVVINHPVKWTKKTTTSNQRINLDHIPINVTVMSEGDQIQDSKIKIFDKGKLKYLDEYEDDKELEIINKKMDYEISRGRDTSRLVSRKRSVQRRIIVAKPGRFMRKLMSAVVTGNAVYDAVNQTTLILEKESDEVEIKYYTEGPLAEEENISNGKRVTISSDIHYETVLAYSNIKDIPAQKIKLYHIIDGSKEKVTFDSHDTNEDGLADYIEWVIPHLSEQIYEIIFITKAEHLNESRGFISDIYDDVKEKDDIWSEDIPAEHYVRVTFEIPLDNTRDITIYAKSNKTAQIEIYRKNNTELITKFTNVSKEGWHKIYLTNLSENESYDTFDLRVRGAAVNFDYIVDPLAYDASNNVSRCGIIDLPGLYIMNQTKMEKNSFEEKIQW